MKRLQQLRETAGLTRYELGGRTKVPAPRLGQIEAGRDIPIPQSVLLCRLADALGWEGDPAGLLEEVE